MARGDESGNGQGSAGRRLLVVDDEPAICEVLRQYLARQGFVVEVAESAEDALALWSAGATYEVVLVDKNLPGKSGIDFVRDAHKNYPDATTVMITGYPSRESVTDALHAGASGYVIKPFESLPKVLEAIEEACERHRRWVAAGRSGRRG